MKRMLSVTTSMLSVTTLAAAVLAGCASGPVAQQAVGDDLRSLHWRNQQSVAAIREEQSPESRTAHKQQQQPSRNDALRSESRGSGLAPVAYIASVPLRIEQVPRPVDAKRERHD